MALGPQNFNLTVNFDSIFCFQGDDIDDWFDEESEPYLWAFMIKIDGHGFTQQGNFLVENSNVDDVVYHFPPGTHGNIGGSILRGTRRIPDNIGKWTTSIKPIPVSNTLNPTQQIGTIPGLIICYGILMEENETDDDTIERAHTAMKDLIKTTVRNTFASLGINGLIADIFTEILREQSNGNTITPGVATQRILDRRLRPVQDLFSLAATGVGIKTILSEIDLGDIPADKFMGVFSRVLTQQELSDSVESAPWLPHGNHIEFGGNMWNMPDWAYNAHGEAFAHRRFVRMAPPAGARLQVSCTRKGLKGLEKRVASIGGVSDNKFWVLTRGEAVNMIQNGQKSFYVKGANGREVEIVVVKGGYYAGSPWYYLQTQSDMIHENNLINLPDCPNGNEYIEIWF